MLCVTELTAQLPAGEVLFGTDSHTCNAGAFGQFASGIGNTDAGFILGTGKLLIKVSLPCFCLSHPSNAKPEALKPIFVPMHLPVRADSCMHTRPERICCAN